MEIKLKNSCSHISGRHNMLCVASHEDSVSFCFTKMPLKGPFKGLSLKKVLSLSCCRGNMLVWVLIDRFNPPMCFSTKGDKQKGNWLLSPPLSYLTCAWFLIYYNFNCPHWQNKHLLKKKNILNMVCIFFYLYILFIRGFILSSVWFMSCCNVFYSV